MRKRPVRQQTKTDTCQMPGTSAMSSEGVVSTLWELEGGIMSLLATQTCCSEHATRMAQEYLQCALVRDSEHAQRTAFGSLQEVWCPNCG
jgi:hypothetical protein